MKRFSLDEYLKNPSRKIVTRDGRKVTRILCTDAKNTFPFVALIKKGNDKGEDVYSFTKNGNFCESTETSLDLFFAPEKKEGWINIYRSESGFYLRGNPYKTKEEADEVAKANYKTFCTTVKIEWEE